MRVLVATNQTQGALAGDYCWTVEGELVTAVSIECCSPHLCGCGRGFPALASDRATTSAVVVDRPDLTRAQVRLALQDSLERTGWLEDLSPEEIDEVLDEHLFCIDTVCRAFPPGTVVGRWGTNVFDRAQAAAAA